MLRASDTAWTDVRDAGIRIAVLPFGALEQHGPHLPLSTDTVVADGVAERLADRLDALLLPPIEYGATWNNAGYPGTVSLSPETVTAIAVDIAEAVATFGIETLVVVNGDWGNRTPLAAAAGRCEALRMLVLDYPGFDEAAERLRESRPAFPGLAHAEELETSLMLALAPGTVHPDRYAACYPVFPADFGSVPMQLHPFSPSGVFGDPSTATAEKGDALISAIVDASEREVLVALDVSR